MRREYQVNAIEPYVQSFIVRIWLEDGAGDAGEATWRGHITHVPSGERRYLRDLDDITAFIGSYLGGMGAKVDLRWRIRNWLNRFGAWTRGILNALAGPSEEQASGDAN